jgi:hypothetical protein
MERLSVEPPRHRVFPRVFNPKYQVTKRYLAEIEAAKSAGYSWDQIKDAVVAEAKAEGIWDGERVCWDVAYVYRQIKKEEM